MIKQEVKVFENAHQLSEGFTHFLLRKLEEYPHINLALSGGSTPKSLFDYWADNCKDSLPWELINFFWGDERCVPPDGEMSNYGMTREHLFDKISKIEDANIYRIHGENEPQEEAKWYNAVLREKLRHLHGIPSFEIVMLGLGDDGHTVSIFPDQISLWDNPASCVVAEHPETKMKRISITGNVVNAAQHVVFLVTGKNKAEKVRDIINNSEGLKDIYPAARVNPTEGNLYWFLDKEAASLL